MAWDFETDCEFQVQLELGSPAEVENRANVKLIRLSPARAARGRAGEIRRVAGADRR
jgi:hypothetical protein